MKKLAQREPIRIPYLAFQLCNLEKKKNRVPYTTPGSKVSIVKWERSPDILPHLKLQGTEDSQG